MSSLCAPHITGKICYSKEDLLLLTDNYNRFNKDTIKYKKNSSRKFLFNQLKERFSTCDNQLCWLKKSNIPNKHIERIISNFRPIQPKSWSKDKYTWLNTLDINNVMEQYEKKHTNFKFFGAVPADCPSGIHCALSNLDFNKFSRDKFDVLGVIYNLDTHNQGGSHWVANVINLKKNEIAYYDSTAHKPNRHINKFIQSSLMKLKKLNKRKPVYHYNTTNHQTGGSECGMFSMNYLIHYLKGHPCKTIFKMKFTDNQMNELRDVLYIKENN
jgi:hypothetical protein